MAAGGPLVGRGRELSILAGAFDEAARGSARLVLLRGDAGIGKSRIVSEFLRRRDQARVLRGRCAPRDAVAVSYAPLLQLVRPLIESGLVDELPAHHREALRPILPLIETEPDGTDAADNHTAWSEARLFEVILTLLRTAARSQPLVAVIEDVHWADIGTANFLQFLSVNLERERVLVLLTQRIDEIGVPKPLARLLAELGTTTGGHVLDVEALDDAEARDLLSGLAAHGATEPTGDDQLLRLGHGNPLYLEQLALARESGSAVGVPARLSELLGWRVGRLSPAAQDLLAVLSVARTALTYPLLAETLDLGADDLDAALTEAAEARMIDETRLDSFTLHHDLLAEVVYRGLRPGRRRRLHAALAERVADTSTTDGPEQAVVAQHWYRAGRPDRAFGPMLAAALSARARGRQAEAADLFAQTLEIWPRDDAAPDGAPDGVERCDVLAWYADSLRWTVDPEEVVTAYRRAIRAADERADARRKGVVQERLARALVDTGHLSEAAATARAAVIALRGHSDVDAARALATLGAILMAQADFADSARHCQEALAIADACGAVLVGARARRMLAVDLANLGQLDAALDCLDAALRAGRDEDAIEDQIHTHINRSYVLERAGRWADAVTSARAGRALAAQSGLERTLGIALLGNEISSLCLAGRWAEARAAAELPLATGAARDSRRYFELVGAEAAIATADLDRAEQLLTGDGGVEPEASNLAQRRIVETSLALARGDPYSAYETAVAALRELADQVEPYVLLRLCADGLQALADLDSPVAGAVLAARAVPADASALLGRARDLASEVGDLEPCQMLLALSDLEAARCTASDAAPGWLALAERAVASGQPHLTAYAIMRAAERSDRDQAAVLLYQAGQDADRIGAALLADRVARVAQRLGVVPAPAEGVPRPDLASDGRAARLDQFRLTAREREVLGCLSSGMSNRVIARTLAISEKTASVHVSNILAKMQVRSRAEVIHAVHQLGLVPSDGNRKGNKK